MPKFNVCRSIRISAPIDDVFDRLLDFSSWNLWSPWLLADKDALINVSDNPSDLGGHYSWDGPVCGAGGMAHTRIVRPEDKQRGVIENRLTFTRPWKSSSQTNFQVSEVQGTPGSPSTLVQWDMQGALPLFLFWMKSMMVSMISMDYDRGLKMLKELTETGGVASETTVVGITQLGPRRIVGLSNRSTLDDIGEAMDTTLTSVVDSLKRAGVDTCGQWISIYTKMNLKTQELDFTSGMVLPESVPTPDGLADSFIQSVKAMQVTHVGDYKFLGNAWSAAHQNLRALKRSPSKEPGFEIYENKPEDTPVKDLVTQVYVPVK